MPLRQIRRLSRRGHPVRGMTMCRRFRTPPAACTWCQSLRQPGAIIRPRSESPWRLGGSMLIACSSLPHGALPGPVRGTSGQATPGPTQPAAYRDLSPLLPSHCAVHRQSDLSCHASDERQRPTRARRGSDAASGWDTTGSRAIGRSPTRRDPIPAAPARNRSASTG
jgi:hypothetical protein